MIFCIMTEIDSSKQLNCQYNKVTSTSKGKSMHIPLLLFYLLNSVRNYTSYCHLSWEPEGRYHYSKVFCWEPEGRYHHWLCTVIAPMKRCWILREPFWLSTNDNLQIVWFIKQQPDSTCLETWVQQLYIFTRNRNLFSLVKPKYITETVPFILKDWNFNFSFWNSKFQIFSFWAVNLQNLKYPPFQWQWENIDHVKIQKKQPILRYGIYMHDADIVSWEPEGLNSLIGNF